jgi:hypothetical protein
LASFGLDDWHIYTPSGAEIVSKSCDHFTRRVRFPRFSLTIGHNHRREVNVDCPAFRLSRRGQAGIFQNATVKCFHEDGLSGEEREVPHCAARKETWLEGSGHGELRIQQPIWSLGQKSTHPRAISWATARVPPRGRAGSGANSNSTGCLTSSPCGVSVLAGRQGD